MVFFLQKLALREEELSEPLLAVGDCPFNLAVGDPLPLEHEIFVVEVCTQAVLRAFTPLSHIEDLQLSVEVCLACVSQFAEAVELAVFEVAFLP